jgi:hypothetical protein
MMALCDTYYGGFRTRKFTDVYESADAFKEDIRASGMSINLSDQSLINLFYLLYARYGNSHIASSDETQFKYGIYSIVFMYGPAWEKRLEIQTKLRGLTEEELLAGGKAIYNHSYNPSTQPSTDTLEELLTINDQNTTKYKKSKLDGYGALMQLLETDVTAYFLERFKKLFIQVLAPDYPLLYVTEEDEDNV